MNAVFADTYYFIALLGSDPRQRQRAIDATTNLTPKLVTTSWILVELGDFLHGLNSREASIRTYTALGQRPDVLVIPASDDLTNRGFALYSSRADKEWSFTDCISFIAMQEAGIAEALTGDRHFEQAGFVALLK